MHLPFLFSTGIENSYPVLPISANAALPMFPHQPSRIAREA